MNREQVLATIYPGWDTGERIDSLRQDVNRSTTEVQQLDAALAGLDDEGIYTESDWGEQFWQRHVVERCTARQIHIQPRFAGDRKIVLDRQKLEQDGEVWHQRKRRHYTLGREVRKFLQARRQQAVDAVERHRQELEEAEINWELYGAAISDDQIRQWTALGMEFAMLPNIEPVEPMTPIESVSWLAEGF